VFPEKLISWQGKNDFFAGSARSGYFFAESARGEKFAWLGPANDEI
jgi:hypothetical protein